MKYSILEIAEILGADASHLNNASIDTLLTDSRTLTYPDRSLFFALHTDSNDGHRYVHLYEKGVRNFVVEHIPEGVPTGDANFIVVKNSIKALQQLASFHRHRFHIPVIGVTGSRGKTQVKEWLFHCCAPTTTSCAVRAVQLADWRAAVGLGHRRQHRSCNHRGGYFTTRRNASA